MCFAGCLVSGVLPNSFMSVMLVPVLKDEAGKLNNMESYRPIAYASMFSKVGLLARKQKTRLEMYDLTSDSQFSLKKNNTELTCLQYMLWQRLYSNTQAWIHLYSYVSLMHLRLLVELNMKNYC